ncbi:MAG: hypothetical protein M5U26_05015 [Planctomycetota bacterium]|nr:hypothetical protein [Planctomycetota bacterium]
MSASELRVRRGGKVEIVVTRHGGSLRRMQLGLRPSRGSNLMAMGGFFEHGEAETRVIVEAPRDARDGRVIVLAKGQAIEIRVKVRR